MGTICCCHTLQHMNNEACGAGDLVLAPGPGRLWRLEGREWRKAKQAGVSPGLRWAQPRGRHGSQRRKHEVRSTKPVAQLVGQAGEVPRLRFPSPPGFLCWHGQSQEVSVGPPRRGKGALQQGCSEDSQVGLPDLANSGSQFTLSFG